MEAVLKLKISEANFVGLGNLLSKYHKREAYIDMKEDAWYLG